MRLHTGLAAILATVLTISGAQAASILVDVNVNARDAAGLQSAVDDFRDDLGANNGNDPVNGDPFGRRQIDWDAAPGAVSAPNPFPGDFFNFNANPRARGIEFEATGATTGFLLSSTAAEAAAPGGVEIGFGFPGSFIPFSQERLFSPVGGSTFAVNFFDPSDQTTPARVRGLGVIFSDVEDAGFTTMSFFGAGGNLLATREAAAGPNSSLTLLGLIFDSFVVSRVEINTGTRPLLVNNLLTPAGEEVVMDDFIFGEPVATIPLPPAILLLASGLLALGALGAGRRRDTA